MADKIRTVAELTGPRNAESDTLRDMLSNTEKHVRYGAKMWSRCQRLRIALQAMVDAHEMTGDGRDGAWIVAQEVLDEEDP